MFLLDYASKLFHKRLFLTCVATTLFVLYTFKTLQCSLKGDRTIIIDNGFNLSLLNGKHVSRGIPPEFLAETNSKVNSTTETVDTNDVETVGSSKYLLVDEEGSKPERRLPQALVIGVKKCGTRALLEFLRIHPDIRAAGSEIHFFDKHYCKGLAWYQHKMPATLRGQLTMEKTPGYYVTKEAPARVFKMNPLIKLLVVVRDPVTRAISDYTQAASKKQGGVADSKEFERQVFVADTNVVDTGWGPIRLGLYSHYLKHWLYFFNISQMLFISGEQLIADPATPMAMVQDFLGIKRVITEKHFYFNATKGFPCLLKSERRAGPHCLGSTKGRSHPEIRPSVIQALRNFYRPFNKKFYHMTGIDFGWP